MLNLKQCDNSKIKYETELHAVKILRIYIDQKRFNKWECHTYQCPRCKFWHIGHASKNDQLLFKAIASKKPQSPIVKLK
jgi:hypothetical protein